MRVGEVIGDWVVILDGQREREQAVRRKKSEEAVVDGVHAKLLTHSQCDDEEWDAVAGSSRSAGLIFMTVVIPFIDSPTDRE
jgi:hypothetical protein